MKLRWEPAGNVPEHTNYFPSMPRCYCQALLVSVVSTYVFLAMPFGIMWYTPWLLKFTKHRTIPKMNRMNWSRPWKTLGLWPAPWGQFSPPWRCQDLSGAPATGCTDPRRNRYGFLLRSQVVNPTHALTCPYLQPIKPREFAWGSHLRIFQVHLIFPWHHDSWRIRNSTHWYKIYWPTHV